MKYLSIRVQAQSATYPERGNSCWHGIWKGERWKDECWKSSHPPRGDVRGPPRGRIGARMMIDWKPQMVKEEYEELTLLTGHIYAT